METRIQPEDVFEDRIVEGLLRVRNSRESVDAKEDD